jgi:hypothetical protein
MSTIRSKDANDTDKFSLLEEILKEVKYLHERMDRVEEALYHVKQNGELVRLEQGVQGTRLNNMDERCCKRLDHCTKRCKNQSTQLAMIAAK